MRSRNRLSSTTWALTAVLLAQLGLGVAPARALDLSTLQPGHWYALPNSRLDSVKPSVNPGGDPKAVVWAWSGAAYDSKRDRLVVWGGGHSDYAGNEVYAFDFGSQAWERLTEPSTNLGSYCSSWNCSNTYPDGKPRARHTYNYIEYVPPIDRFISFGGSGPWQGGGGGFSRALSSFDFDTRSWDYSRAPLPSGGDLIGSSAVYDPVTGKVWHHSSYGSRLASYDPVADSWQTHATTSWLEISNTMAIDTKRHIMVAVGGYAGTRQIKVWDLDKPGSSPYTPNTNGSPIESGEAPGFVYDPVIDKFVGWDGGTTIYTLDADTWTWTAIGAAASNSVYPGDAEPKGTYGRFRYIPAHNVYALVNYADQPVYLYKMSTGGGTPPALDVSLSASPTTVDSGSNVTLQWSTTSATACSASGGTSDWSGSKPLSGSQSVGPLSADATYVLTCQDAGGNTLQRSASVTVNAVAPPPPPPTGGGDLPSLTIQSQAGTAQSGVPLTFGQVFKKGAVPAGSTLGARLASGSTLELQVDEKATHRDGSLRHAILTTRVPSLAAGASEVVQLETGASAPSGVPVSISDVLASGFDATVSLNVGGTVYSASAADLLSGQPTKWLEGPLATEWIVGGPVKTSGGSPHAHLTAYFHVRAYKGSPVDRVRVGVVVENNWSFVPAPGNRTYDATIRVGGNTVYTRTGINHYHHARWHKQFWWGAQPQAYVQHDHDYLQDSKAIPKYEDVTPTNSLLASVRQSVEPMDNGDHNDNMQDGGYQPGIGPLPRWDAVYAVSADHRAYNWMRANADAGGAYSVHYRDENTKLPITIDAYPNSSLSWNSGSSPQFPAPSGGNPFYEGNWASHQPSMGYLPYIVSGDYFYLEEAQFWTAYNLIWVHHLDRGGNTGIWYTGSLRGKAWAYRSLAQVAYITPDDHPLKTYFNEKLQNNLSRDIGAYVSPGGPYKNNLGAMYMLEGNEQYRFFDYFMSWVVQYLVDLDYTEATPFRDYKVKFPIGLMGLADGEYCFQAAPQYTWKVGPGGSSSFYADFAEVYRNTKPGADAYQCGTQAMASFLNVSLNEMQGMQDSTTFYFANLQPALASAADSGVPGGADAWQRSQLSGIHPDYRDNPIWAVVPRSLTGTAPQNQAPTAIFSASPTSGTAPLGVSFDASGSSDADGSVVGYAWDFGDGATATGSSASHTYSTSGSFNVTLTVVDDDGASASMVRTISVSAALPPPNQAPTAAFSLNPTSGKAPLAVTVNASGSSDADGSIVAYTWSFGDGGSASGPFASHSYTTAGSFTITLTVQDDDGATASTTRTVSVAPPNEAPVPAFTVSPTSGEAPVAVSVNASGSSDADGSIVSYAWRFSDGATASGITASRTFSTPALYTVTLTVRDNDGAEASLSKTFTVNAPANQAPVAQISATPTSGEAPLTVTFDGRGSSDDGSIVGYAWSFGDGASASGPTASHTYDSAGVFAATLTVTDDLGATATTSRQISVSEPPPPPVSDTDGDGLDDAWEQANFGTLARNGSGDFDHDGATDAEEFTLGLNPTAADTDGDGAIDGEELTYGSSPSDPLDNWQDRRPRRPTIAAVASPVAMSTKFDVDGGYSDPDGDVLDRSEWEIATASTFQPHELVLARANRQKTEMKGPLGSLKRSAGYWMRTRHVDADGMPSEWSAPAWFSTVSTMPNDGNDNLTNDAFEVLGSYDVNANGVADAQEPSMCNLLDAETNRVVGLEVDEGTIHCLRSLSSLDPEIATLLPEGVDAPFGLFNFLIDGLTSTPTSPAKVRLTMYFPEAVPDVNGWYLYDEAVGEVLRFDGMTSVSGNVVTVELEDGGRGDLDGVVNGIIVDPSGPVVLAVDSGAGSGDSQTGDGGGGVGAVRPLEGLLLALAAVALVRLRSPRMRD